MKKIIPIFLCVVLAGCITPQQEKIIMSKCPVLKSYSRDQLVKAASELNMLPDESQISLMLSDYSKLRDACRIADKKLKSMYRKKPKEQTSDLYTRGG